MHIEKEESNLNHLRSNNFVITKSAYVFDSQVAKISTKGGGEGRGEGGGGGAEELFDYINNEMKCNNTSFLLSIIT